MENPKSPPEEKNLWDDLRDTVRGGMHDLRNIGDELARQGRVRMDIFQTERRLKMACEELGRAVNLRFIEQTSISAEDPTLAELNTRIAYYSGELKRLREDLQSATGNFN